MANKQTDKNGGGEKLFEKQFEFLPAVTWKAASKSQKILHSELVTVEPNLGWNKDKMDYLEIEIKKDDEKRKDMVLGFGPMTRFIIGGSFRQENGTVSDLIPKADCTKMILQPNWFRAHIKSFEMYHDGVRVFSSDENKYTAPYSEALLYSVMDETQKNMLMPEPWHPGRGVPTRKDGWSMKAGSEWLTWSQTTLERDIEFGWIPLHFAPFFQDKNYMDKKKIPNFLPTPVLGNITIRFMFNDNMASIFRQPAENTEKYFFKYTKFNFQAEYLKLSQSWRNTVVGKKGLLHFSGVTKMMKVETIIPGAISHQLNFKSISMPEGIVIFVLPKHVIGGTFDYNKTDDLNVFRTHHIDKVTLAFGEKALFNKEPNLGTINDDLIERKMYFDLKTVPPFGTRWEEKKITLEIVKDGFKDSAYPMAWINLLNTFDKSRVVPYDLTDGKLYEKPNQLDFNIHLKPEGAPTDMHYMVYVYYTDQNLILDMSKKDKIFTNTYVKLLSASSE